MDTSIDGILLQHPVPRGVDERAAFEAIAPSKDVDGVTKDAFASMSFGLPGFASCTPGGIMRLLDAYEVDLAGRHAVVIGRSPILGKPIGMLLLARDATVTYCHSHTVDLSAIVRTADIVVAAVGRANFVRGSGSSQERSSSTLATTKEMLATWPFRRQDRGKTNNSGARRSRTDDYCDAHRTDDFGR